MTELYEALQQQKDNIRVGSVVRGEAREDSDIDLLVDFLPGTTLLDQIGLIDALSTALESVELIQSSIEGYDLTGFLADRKTQDAMIRNA